MMFGVSSLLPMSSDFGDCIAFRFKDVLQSRLLMHRRIDFYVLLVIKEAYSFIYSANVD